MRNGTQTRVQTQQSNIENGVYKVDISRKSSRVFGIGVDHEALLQHRSAALGTLPDLDSCQSVEPVILSNAQHWICS
jgi:hypothetical protein